MKLPAVLILFIFSFSGLDLYSQYPIFRLNPSNKNQIEPSIVRHPINQQILFASAFTISGNRPSEGVYVSTNGGLNWTGVDTVNDVTFNNHGGDPGPIIDKNGVFILSHIGFVQTGMFANYSINLGANWSINKTIYQDIVDKCGPGTDDAPASPFYGRSFVAFTKFAPPFRIVLSYTTNSGNDWSGLINVNNSYGSNRSFGPSIAVNPSGTVFIVWASAIPNSPYTEDCVGVSRSTNGGADWTVNECAIDCNGIRTTTLSPWSIRANSYPAIDIDKTGGPRNGWIYIAITNKNLAPAGSDPDIVLHRSTDNGNSWSAGIRVNRDPINNGKNQFFPAIRVDENGGLNIIYYDNRNVTDSLDVFLSRSVDGGLNWNDYLVTDRRFYPRPVAGTGGGNMGDNLGLTSGNGFLYPVWMSDLSSSVFQVWSARIDYSTIGVKQIGSEIPLNYNLSQNYPNPFNPLTKIRFDIPKDIAANVKLIVYDINGKETRTIVDRQLNPGTYEADFDGTNLASGMYFYTLIASGFTETKKMILVK
jgi:hypothetical protein